MDNQILTLDVGPSQLIARLCDEIHLEEIINEQVTWDKARCGLSPGTRIKALVINILCKGNPLYKVHETYEKLDLELLFGTGVTNDQFNDDSLGRALDYLYKAVPWKVYTSVALSALKVLNLSLGALHNDTTSFSVYGEYKKESKPESDSEDKLDITYGFSKQRRPDLKQIVLGMSVTPERIPILANVEDGNKSDKAWNMEFIKKLREILRDEEWENILYQADSALITTDNLKDLASNSLTFLSRLPDTFGLSTELKTKAWSKDAWIEIGKLVNKKDAATYRFQVFEEKIDETPYRFSVVHSDQLDKQKAKRLERELEKEAKEVNKAIEKLQKTAFHCEADAQEAKLGFEQEHKVSLHHYELAVYSEEEAIKRKRRGRPKKGEKIETKTVYRVRLKELIQNEEAIEDKRRLLSTFVLITNELDQKKVSDFDILTIYKGQSAAETRFRLLKDHQMIDAVYLKTPERIQAIGVVYVMALLIYGMLEYRVRSNMKMEKEALILRGKRKLFMPTGKALLEQLDDVRVILIKQNGKITRYLPDNINDQTKRVVELCGYDMTIYVSNTEENSNG